MGQPASILNHAVRQRDRLQRAVQHAWPQASADDRDLMRRLLLAVEDGEMKAADASAVVVDIQREQQRAA